MALTDRGKNLIRIVQSAFVLIILRLLWRGTKSSTPSAFPHGNRFIFAVSPGRAGTGYLRHALGCAEGVLSRHEAEPKMNGDILEEVLLKGRRLESLESRSNLKLGGIENDLMGSVPGMVYVETSHMMVKTFLDVVLWGLAAKGAQVDIIILRRDRMATIISQAKLGWFTRDHSGKDVWYYSVSDLHPSEQMENVRIRSSNITSESRRLEDLVAYNYDNEMRARKLMSDFKEGRLPTTLRVHEVELEKLQTIPQVRSLLCSLDLTPDEDRLSLLSSADRNSRDRKKDFLSKSQENLLPSIMSLYEKHMHLKSPSG